VNLEYQ